MEGKPATDFLPELLTNDIKEQMQIVYGTGKEEIKTYHDPLQREEDIWYRTRLLLSEAAFLYILITNWNPYKA